VYITGDVSDAVGGPRGTDMDEDDDSSRSRLALHGASEVGR
jgi:hypothetical protein